MSYQSGKELLIKVDFGSGYATIGGFRSNSFTINGETIDVTNKDSNGFRELISGGFRSVSLSASGVFKGDDEFTSTNNLVLSGTFAACQLIVPGLGTYSGTFAFKSLQMSGEYNGEVTYSLSLDSAGEVTFAAAS